MERYMTENLIIKGARQNNLKNIDVIIPRNKLSKKPALNYNFLLRADINYLYTNLTLYSCHLLFL